MEDLAKAIWALSAAAVGYLINSVLKRQLDRYYERKRVTAELKDLYRHFDANVKVLNIIDTSQDMISPIHFQKLKVPESSTMLFQIETLRNININHVPYLSELKLQIRNINIEIEGAIIYFSSTEYNPEVGIAYLDLLESKAIAQKYSVGEVLITINTVDLNNNFLLNIFNKIIGIREVETNKIIPEIKPSKRPKTIIYHKQKINLLQNAQDNLGEVNDK